MTQFSRRGFLKSLAALAAEGSTHTSLSSAEKMVAVFQESKKYVPVLIKALSSIANPIRYSVFDIKGSNGYIQSHSALGELPNLLCGLKLFLEKSNTRETM